MQSAAGSQTSSKRSFADKLQQLLLVAPTAAKVVEGIVDGMLEKLA
jgi:hypothetical protein